MEDKIIVQHATKLADMDKTGVADMLKDKRLEELKKIFELFRRRQSVLKNILDKLHPYIVQRGKEISMNKDFSTDPVVYITQLVSLKFEIDAVVEGPFYGHEQFHQVKDRAFQEIMEDFEYSAKFLAEYIDSQMRQGIRGKKEAEIDEVTFCSHRDV